MCRTMSRKKAYGRDVGDRQGSTVGGLDRTGCEWLRLTGNGSKGVRLDLDLDLGSRPSHVHQLISSPRRARYGPQTMSRHCDVARRCCSPVPSNGRAAVYGSVCNRRRHLPNPPHSTCRYKVKSASPRSYNPPSRPFPSLHLAPVPKARLPRPARRTRLVDPRWTTLDHTRPTTPASSSFPRASSSRPRRRSISPCRPPSTARTLSLQSQTSLPMPAIRPHHTIPPSQLPHPPPSPPPPRPIPPGPHIAPPALARRCTPLVGETQNQRSSPICTPIVPTTSPQTPAILSCPAKTPRISTMVCHLPVISSRSSTSQCFLLPLGVRS